MVIAVLIIIFFAAAALILYLCHRYNWLDKIGAVVIAYIAGALIGNMGILPEGSDRALDLISTITVPLAFPLLLFSMNLRNWVRLAGKTMLSMLLALVAVLLVVITGHYVFGGHLPDAANTAGMMIGIYTGGTPNLASIRTALGVEAETYLLIHTYDIVIGAAFFLVIISVAHRLLQIVLPSYSVPGRKCVVQSISDAEGIDNYGGMLSKKYGLPLLAALGLSVSVFAISGLLSMAVSESVQMAVVILAITTLGILLSLVPRIHNIEKTFQLGMYFIVVFCLAVAAMADLGQVFSLDNLNLLFYVLWVYFGSMLLHVLISAIFRIDADTVLITITALLYSPPFVPVVAGAIRNRDIVLSGITVGIIGYAIGNYIGTLLALALR